MKNKTQGKIKVSHVCRLEPFLHETVDLKK